LTDKELIARKIALISQDLDELKKLGAKTAGEFLADKIERFAAERDVPVYLEHIAKLVE